MSTRILICRLSSLGDVVCTLPVAVALKKQLPESRISWLVDTRFKGVVECSDAVDEVLANRPRVKFDIALDMQGLIKSAIPVALSGAPTKLAYHWQREGAGLFARRVLPDPSSFHIVDQYVDVARALGCEVDAAEFGLTPRHEDVLAVRAKLKAKEITGRFVVMNAGAGWATKRWPPESFAKLADHIAKSGLTPVFIGGKNDPVPEAPNAKSLIGETSIRELIALIRLASAHIGGDTGSTHIAAALGTPALGLYSITRPERSCPYGQRDRCLYDGRGLSYITPENVIAKLAGIL